MSPFEIFRRNLKPLMVFLTALALFAFVVLPAMQTYLQRGGGNVNDPQVAVFDGVPVMRSRVDYLTRNHQSTVRFLRELATETIRRDGSPRTPGFVYDTQNQQIRSIGINERPSLEGTVQTLLFVSEANRAGFELDDTAIKSWLTSFTDGTMSDSEIISLLMTSTRNQMGQYHLYEQLRNQLLAGLYQNSWFAGVVDGQLPLMTPAEQWAAFLKINRKATVDSYGVLVNDYIDQTNQSPPESEIAAVYTEGIKRYPDDQSAEPGFRRRETATFEYLVADMKAFTDREIETISEEELKAEYEKRLKGGDFQLPDMPEQKEPEKEETTDGPTPAEATTDAAEAAGEKEMKKEEPGDAEEKQPEPAETPAAQPEQEDETAKNRQQMESFKQELDAVRDEARQDEPANDDQSQANRSTAVRLVAVQQDAGEAETAETAEAGEKAAEEKPADPDQPAESKPAPASEEKAAEADQPAPKGPEADAETAADEKPAPAKPADDEDQAAEEEEPKVESFEDVRDRIAQSLAGPPARQKIDAAVTEVTGVMRRYFNEKAIHESNVSIGQAGDPPTKPDLKGLAEKLGMEFQVVGPHDIASIGNEPISRSSEVGTQLGRRGPSFTAMMYGVESDQSFIPKQQLFSPLRTADDAAGRVYVSWKVAEKEGYVPDLDEVRGEVIMAIRQREARELARAAADTIAEEVNAGKALAELIPEEKMANFKEGLGPFSWMNSFGFQGAFLGNVPELDSVGDEFMRTVFSTQPGQAGVAPNQPERVFYVVKPTNFQPHIDDLKQIFKQPQERIMALPLGSNDVRAIWQGSYESVRERTNFEFAEDDQPQ